MSVVFCQGFFSVLLLVFCFVICSGQRKFLFLLTDPDPDPEDSLPQHASLHGVRLVHLRWVHVLWLGHLESVPHQGKQDRKSGFENVGFKTVL